MKEFNVNIIIINISSIYNGSGLFRFCFVFYFLP